MKKMRPQNNTACISEMFSQISGKYDFLNHLLSFGLDRKWRRKAVEVLMPPEDASVLDICCGTGDLLLEFAGRCSNCTGLDISEEMVQKAQSKMNKSELGKSVRIICANAEELNFEDETFDIVSIAFGLRNISDKHKALSQAARVLKQGGKLLVLEFSFPRKGVFAAFHRFYLHFIVPVIGFIFSGSWSAYKYLYDSVRNFYSPVDVAGMIEDCGFSSVKIRAMSSGLVYMYEAKKTSQA